MLKTRLSETYSLKHPFICAGMAFVCDKPDLCVAVCEAGGIGSITGSLLSPEQLDERLKIIKATTDTPFHVNFLTCYPHKDKIETCIQNQVPIVSFHWGIPDPDVIERLKAAGTSVWQQVGSMKNALAAERAGMDAIIAQGNEAGGHNYCGLPIMALLPALRDALQKETLLFAAGGISDGRTAAAALVAGADGVWVGTRLVATNEANAHPDHKARIVAATGDETILTSVYGPEDLTFNPMRMIRNETVDAWHDRIPEIPLDRSDMEPIAMSDVAGNMLPFRPFDILLPVPETTGDIDRMPMLCGQGAGLIKDVVSAGEIVDRMMSEAATIIASAVR